MPLPILANLFAFLRRDAHDSIYTRWLFLRLLALSFFAAFLSFWTQLDGLIGPRGLYPVAETLDLWTRLSPSPRFDFPSLFWLNSTEATLHAHCALGLFLAILLFFNIAPALCCALLSLLYISLCNGDQIFLSYQWDVLLIETGFLAVFFAPWRPWPCLRTEPPPPWPALWLLRLLFFKLYFMSGVGKLVSRDPHWSNLTALQYHYESQPLPTWLGWAAHQLPPGLQTFSTLMVFFIEIFIPFFIFAPRGVRRFACAFAVLLQGLIELTGNYAFFNLLTFALCLLLLDDPWIATTGARTLRWRIGRWVAKFGREAGAVCANISKPHFYCALFAFIVLLPGNVFMLVNDASGFAIRVPGYDPVRAQLVHWKLIGQYELFTTMTTGRREILIEVSDDGQTWREVPFRWKPGDPLQRPQFIAPHQPRLDWQLWFAALGHPASLQTVERLMQAIADQRPEVLALMNAPDFKIKPRHIRAVIYDYKMTQRGQPGWWRRNQLGILGTIENP